MSTEIKVPPLGESIVEATIIRWFKAVGDRVNENAPLVELETEKVTVEVPAPVSGVLLDIRASVGETISVGATLGIIEETQEARLLVSKTSSTNAIATDGRKTLEQLSPAVRRMVVEHDLNPSIIPTTGRSERLTKEDILNFQEYSSALKVPPTEKEERVRMTQLRQRIALRLKKAQNVAAILTTFNEIDMTEVVSLRERYRAQFERTHNIRLGFMSFFTKACVKALIQFPMINAEIDKEDIVYKRYYHIGVAVGTTHGLVVPVVRNAESKSLAAIEIEIASLRKKALDSKLSVEELSGGTFTITNGGIYGSLVSTPILNPPQSGILGMHKIQKRPVVMPDGTIMARPMMYVALSYDHRLIDGREAVSFLVQIKESIEDPIRLLLDT